MSEAICGSCGGGVFCPCDETRPPAEPKEWACKECGTVEADGGGHHPHCPMRPFGYRPPTPSSSSVEDAKCEKCGHDKHGKRCYGINSITETECLCDGKPPVKSNAAKQIQRQTPAIIERFVEEVEWELKLVK